MACPYPMSPLSAALPLAAWISAHGRYPVDTECVASNGLPHFTTLYKMFPGSSFSARISLALVLLQDVLTTHVKLRACLGTACTVRFYTTPNVRLCPRCRTTLAHSHDDSEMPALQRAQLRRWGVGMADWEEGVAW